MIGVEITGRDVADGLDRTTGDLIYAGDHGSDVTGGEKAEVTKWGNTELTHSPPPMPTPLPRKYYLVQDVSHHEEGRNRTGYGIEGPCHKITPHNIHRHITIS